MAMAMLEVLAASDEAVNTFVTIVKHCIVRVHGPIPSAMEKKVMKQALSRLDRAFANWMSLPDSVKNVGVNCVIFSNFEKLKSFGETLKAIERK